ncbi:hypothetical protein Micbo1qcDRAFT_169954, partial [Microdochium bolleyi]
MPTIATSRLSRISNGPERKRAQGFRRLANTLEASRLLAVGLRQNSVGQRRRPVAGATGLRRSQDITMKDKGYIVWRSFLDRQSLPLYFSDQS